MSTDTSFLPMSLVLASRKDLEDLFKITDVLNIYASRP